MNLVELFSKELRDKHFSDFEKARYIYLRCCQIFSFDARWNYFALFSEEQIRAIENKIFDIFHIDSRLVICHTFSKSILKPLLDEFTSYSVSVEGDNHSYVTFQETGKKWILDGTLGDFPRVKMGLNAEGFYQEKGEYSFTSLDASIGFPYVSKEKYRVTSYETGYDYMNQVSSAICSSRCRFFYSDVIFLYNYMSYLMRQDSKTYLDSNHHLYRLIHFTENEEDYIIQKRNGSYSLELTNKKTR